jgi:hypothetical protein
MSKNELEILHSMQYNMLHIDTTYDKNTITLEYIEDFVKNTSILEYNLSNTISKFNWKITNY